MKILKASLLGAVLFGCLSCVEADPTLGGNMIPIDQQYEIYTVEFPIDEVLMEMADSLSGYSSSRITIGAIRDDQFGLTNRSCALTLVPLYDTLDFGAVQKINSFRLSAAFDTVSVSRPGDERILQKVMVTKLDPGTPMKKLIDANDVAGLVKHGTTSIVKGTPIIDGKSNLALEFTEDFAKDYIKACQGKVLSKDFESFISEMPGIHITTDEPSSNGGRINTFDLQMVYNTSYYYLEDNYGTLNVTTVFDEEVGPVDTSFFFYYGAMDYHPLDSLVSNASSGSYPEYAVNLSKHSSRSLSGSSSDKVLIEGGAGLKPVIKASTLRSGALKAIADTLMAHGYSAERAKDAIINKASIILPFEMPADYTELDNFFPPRLSPTCRIHSEESASFMGLSDASSADENQGDINRSVLQYAPDITYHLQQILKVNESNESYINGSYDIWLLLMSIVTTTSTSSGNSDMSEYLQYLAYQNYYNNMYGGYGGYGGYGYGGYGNSYYSNYYSYMLAAMYAGGQTTTSSDYQLDTDLYYRAALCGPNNANRQPSMKIIFSISKQ